MAVTGIELFTNNAQSTLAGDITNVATTANLASGTGALFPVPGANQYFLMTFVDALTGNVNEIVKVTAMSGDTVVTMVRAQEGTAARPWLAGDSANHFMTAGTADLFAQPRDLQSQSGNYGADSGTANAMVVTLTTVPPTLAAILGTDIRITKGGADNTGAVTVAVNGLPATPVVDLTGSPLAAGALPSGGTFTLIYDGTHFVLQGSISIAPAGRTLLSGNLDLYVATTGNDSNDGLSSGTPWLTLQHAWNVIFDNYDLQGHVVTVHIANGTYTDGIQAIGRPPGQALAGSIVFSSTSGNPAACIIDDTSNVISAANGAALTIQGVTIGSSGGHGLVALDSGYIVFSNLVFAGVPSGSYHIFAFNSSTIETTDNYAISGNADIHYFATRCGVIYIHDTAVVTLTGTPAFAQEFVLTTDCGIASVDSGSVTFTGGATGKRYLANLNGVIDTIGGGANYFPGSIAGTVATGGQYA